MFYFHTSLKHQKTRRDRVTADCQHKWLKFVLVSCLYWKIIFILGIQDSIFKSKAEDVKGSSSNFDSNISVLICLFKVNNRNTRTSCEICSKLTIKTPQRRQWRRSGDFIVSFEHEDVKGSSSNFDSNISVRICLFKVNNRNTRTSCEICPKLTIKTPQRRQWRRSGDFIVNFEHISHLVLVFLLLTLSR